MKARDLHLDGIVGVVGSLETLDADGHLSLGNDGGGSIVVDRIAHGGVELVDVFSVDSERLESLTLERFGDVVALEVFGRVAAVWCQLIGLYR